VTRAAKSFDSCEFSDLKLLQNDYWEALWETLRKTNSPLKGSKPRPQHWNNFAIGRTGFKLDAVVHAQKQFIQAGLYISDRNATDYFELLRQQQHQIEAEFGGPLDWRPLPNKTASRIVCRKSEVDPTNRGDWPAQHSWFRETLERLDRVFRQRVANLDLGDGALIG
jgi:hypothetical protein